MTSQLASEKEIAYFFKLNAKKMVSENSFFELPHIVVGY